jgi:hypothetical protein
MGRRRAYELVVGAVIAEHAGATVVTLREAEASSSLSLPQPKETLKPGTVVRITIEGVG